MPICTRWAASTYRSELAMLASKVVGSSDAAELFWHEVDPTRARRRPAAANRKRVTAPCSRTGASTWWPSDRSLEAEQGQPAFVVQPVGPESGAGRNDPVARDPQFDGAAPKRRAGSPPGSGAARRRRDVAVGPKRRVGDLHGGLVYRLREPPTDDRQVHGRPQLPPSPREVRGQVLAGASKRALVAERRGTVASFGGVELLFGVA